MACENGNIYVDQPLRLEAVPCEGMTGIVSSKFGYLAPGSSTVAYFTPAIEDVGEGIIYYDIPKTTLVLGIYTFWGWVDYGNGGIPGKPIRAEIKVEGTI